ncbi:lamin tail domain-containing protein [Thermaurantimonas aggregans]|uniref:lamin tail domain-containing protein n=1 Tax=Thermaurantimonas aggregans TaxID=2173829 RepID=UPI0023F24289|nr:lamin tail domain-containing protein [Thermaurantimonas aggregans]MCX8148236.1 lamin tail domain-containing protein [Thermaurantimonas aggregans]
MTSHFRVQNEELQLYDTTLSGTSWLSTGSTAAFNGFWQFKVRLEFNPSTQNFAQVFIVSNLADVSGAVNGYFVRIGGTTNRRISLVRRSGTTNTTLIESVDNVVNTNVVNARIRVENNNGVWTLMFDTSASVNPSYVVAGTAFDTTFRRSSFFGVLCRFTSTRFDKMFFDDFVIQAEEFKDTVPPVVTSVVASSPTQVVVRFSEPVSNIALLTGNYFISDGIGAPITAQFLPGSTTEVLLSLSAPLQINKLYSIRIEEVTDLAGNEISTTVLPLAYTVVKAFDVVINEILADPTPVVGLPDAEYIELYNRLNVPVSLDGWRLMVNNTSIALNGVIPADSFAVITRSQAVALFPANITTIGVNMSSTQLTNSGARLRLFNSNNELIHSVTYSDQWYASSAKREGGWSLEQVDPTNFCGQERNWRESVHPSGGTPGRRNSVNAPNPDTLPLRITNFSIPTPTQIRLIFNKSLHPSPAVFPDFSIKPDPGILAVNYDSVLENALVIDLIDPLIEGLLYEMEATVRPIDCQLAQALSEVYYFGLPLAPRPGDVILNELLFNQPTNGAKFIEIVNTSTKVLDLSKIKLSNVEGGQFQNIQDITADPILLLPGAYLVITNSISGVQTFYNTECNTCFIQSSLPTMNIGSGNVALLNADLEVLDYFEYEEKMHSPMIRNPKGVSLERISFSSPQNDSRYWKSAAQQVGFATPGYKNSQQAVESSTNQELEVVPKTFSPNNDGFNDFVQIHYQLDDNNYVGTLQISDLNGNLIKTVAASELLSDSGYFVWDGTDEKGRKVSLGIYVVIFDLFHPERGRKILKSSVGLTY